jgi:hypothetical protein
MTVRASPHRTQQEPQWKTAGSCSIGLEGRERALSSAADGAEVIVMGVPEQDLDTSFAVYRQAVEMAEAVRQRAIAAALADHRRVLEDIEAAYRRDLAAARFRYSQRTIGQRAAEAIA